MSEQYQLVTGHDAGPDTLVVKEAVPVAPPKPLADDAVYRSRIALAMMDAIEASSHLTLALMSPHQFQRREPLVKAVSVAERLVDRIRELIK